VPAVVAEDQGHVVDAADDQAVLAAAHDLHVATRGRNVYALMSLVGSHGASCVDLVISRQRIRRELRNPNTFVERTFLSEVIQREIRKQVDADVFCGIPVNRA